MDQEHTSDREELLELIRMYQPSVEIIAKNYGKSVPTVYRMLRKDYDRPLPKAFLEAVAKSNDRGEFDEVFFARLMARNGFADESIFGISGESNNESLNDSSMVRSTRRLKAHEEYVSKIFCNEIIRQGCSFSYERASRVYSFGGSKHFSADFAIIDPITGKSINIVVRFCPSFIKNSRVTPVTTLALERCTPFLLDILLYPEAYKDKMLIFAFDDKVIFEAFSEYLFSEPRLPKNIRTVLLGDDRIEKWCPGGDSQRIFGDLFPEDDRVNEKERK